MRRPWAGWTMIGAFVVASAFLLVGPVGAQPTVTVPEPVGAPEDGDIIEITIDTSTGLDGASGIGITSCGNGESYWIYEDTLPFSRGCHDLLITNQARDGETFSGGGFLIVEPGGTATLDYVWGGFDGTTTCYADAPTPCTIRLLGYNNALQVVWERIVPITTSSPLPVVGLDWVEVTEGDSGFVDIEIEARISREVEWPVLGELRLRPVEGRVRSSSYPEIDPRDAVLLDSYIDVTNDPFAKVRIYGDRLDEIDERVVLQLSFEDGNLATPAPPYGLSIITIEDDDEPPFLIPGTAGTLEDDTTVMVPFTLDRYSSFDVTFDWEVGGHGPTAIPGEDYFPASGSAVIPAGELSVEIPIEIPEDDVPEEDELLVVATANLQNARPSGFYGLAFVGILNDEPFPDCLDRLEPGANLSWCDFSGETIIGADLVGADLRWADLTDATIVNGDWSAIRATNASLDGATFANVNLTNADFTDGGGAVSFVSSTLDHASLDGAFAGTRIVSSTARGAYLHGSFDGGLFSLSDFSWADLTTARYRDAVWSGSICGDQKNSGDTFDTCQRMVIGVGHRGYSGNIVVGRPSKSYESIWILLQGSEGYSPGLYYYGAEYWFGPTGFEVPISSRSETTVDTTGDGIPDAHWNLATAESGLTEDVTEVCIAGQNGQGDRAFGCTAVTVTEWDDDSDDGGPDDPISPPASPPTSPPTSPSTSPPISGGGALAGLVPFLTEPIGLMATATGAGLLFLLGSRRAEAALREDDADELAD